MRYIFNKLSEEEKSDRLKAIDQNLVNDFNQIGKDIKWLSDKEIRLDVRAIGVGCFLLPLSILQAGLSGLRYSARYTREYALKVSNRIKDNSKDL